MPRPRVLVADDNPVSLRFFADALAALAVDCVLAADGDQALARAREAAFDALILDWRMPGLDGVEVLVRLRAGRGPSAAAPALASTAQLDAAQRARLLAAGFAEVLSKPLGIAALRSALARHLPAWTAAAGSDGVLDEAQALAAAGGDAAIVAALRGLFAAELEALPAELAELAAARDPAALRERLHRLAASAGFCGAPRLQHAIDRARGACIAGAWPAAACAALLADARELRAALVERLPPTASA